MSCGCERPQQQQQPRSPSAVPAPAGQLRCGLSSSGLLLSLSPCQTHAGLAPQTPAEADEGRGRSRRGTRRDLHRRFLQAPASIPLCPGHLSPSRCPLLLPEQGRRRSAGVPGRQLPQLWALACRAMPCQLGTLPSPTGRDGTCPVALGYPPPHLGGSSSPCSHTVVSMSKGGSAPPHCFLGKAPRAWVLLARTGDPCTEKNLQRLALNPSVLGLLLRGVRCLL